MEEVCVGRTCFVYSVGEGGENVLNLVVSWERCVFDYDWKVEVMFWKKCEGPDGIGIRAENAGQGVVRIASESGSVEVCGNCVSDCEACFYELMDQFR